MSIRKRITGLALVAVVVGSVLAAPAAFAGGYPYNAYCGSDSGFTNTTGKTRTFGYVWRQGTTVLGAGYVRLANGASFGPATTPSGAERFGVVTNSTTYAYVTCS